MPSQFFGWVIELVRSRRLGQTTAQEAAGKYACSPCWLMAGLRDINQVRLARRSRGLETTNSRRREKKKKIIVSEDLS